MVFIANNLFCCNPPFNFYSLSLAKTHQRYKSNDGFQTTGADHLTKKFGLKVNGTTGGPDVVFDSSADKTTYENTLNIALNRTCIKDLNENVLHYVYLTLF